MNRRTLPAAAVCAMAVVLALQAASGAQETGTHVVDDPEAYAVYVALLSEVTPPVRHNRTFVFQEETATNWDCMPAGRPLETDWKPVLDSFRAENVGPKRLLAGFQLGVAYTLVPAAELEDALDETAPDGMSGWERFHERYPGSGGIMIVSAVGFDADRRRAMVYMARSCGSLCGSGAHHLLEKVDGLWRVAAPEGLSNCIWMS